MRKRDIITAIIIFLTLSAAVMMGKFIAIKYAESEKQEIQNK